jgi:hypothetical protein
MGFLRKIFSPHPNLNRDDTPAPSSVASIEKPYILLDSSELIEGVFSPIIIEKADLSSIAVKLQSLRDLAEQHPIDGIGLGTTELFPSTSDDISEFELKYDVKLPEDFKSFLEVLGYDIFPYNQPNCTPYVLKSPYGIAAEPMAQQPNWYLDADKRVIKVSDYGCGISFVLCLFQKEQGNIWTHDPANSGTACPVIPKNDAVDRIRFLDWYNYWLDAALASINKELS